MTGCSQDKCFQYPQLSQSYTLSEALSENTHNFLRTALELLRVVEEHALIIMYQSATAGDETTYGGPTSLSRCSALDLRPWAVLRAVMVQCQARLCRSSPGVNMLPFLIQTVNRASKALGQNMSPTADGNKLSFHRCRRYFFFSFSLTLTHTLTH